jgi:hypothetical protein
MELDWTELETAGRANIPWQKQQQQEMQIAGAEEWWWEAAGKGELVNLRLPPPDWPSVGDAGIKPTWHCVRGQAAAALESAEASHGGRNVAQNTWTTARVALQAGRAARGCRCIGAVLCILPAVRNVGEPSSSAVVPTRLAGDHDASNCTDRPAVHAPLQASRHPRSSKLDDTQQPIARKHDALEPVPNDGTPLVLTLGNYFDT